MTPHTGDLFASARDDVFAQVAVPVPASGTFTYRVPPAATGLVMPGSRVMVRFAGRQLSGVVVATSTAPPADVAPGKIRALDDCLDPRPLLSPIMLALTHWVSVRTMASWGEAIRSALPMGIDKLGRRRATISESGRAIIAAGAAAAAELPPGALQLLRALERGRYGALNLSALARNVDPGPHCALLYELARREWVDVADEWSTGVGGRWENTVGPARHVGFEEALERTARAPAQRRVVELLWERGAAMEITELRRAADCGAAAIKSMVGRGLLEPRRQALGDDARNGWSGGDDGAGSFDLMENQRIALQHIEDRRDGYHRVLLHGVTGSGKTEVYLRAARETIARGRTVLLLVPEIGLTPLLAHRAKTVLGDAVGVLHSGMSEGERLSNWWRARSGAFRAIVGPRSAVFAPLADVGLIIVDEEQDGAYKQDEAPRYHGRDVALERARLEGATVVMGSATPAVETYFAASRGRYDLVPMPERVAARPLPEVQVVDMREEYRRSGRSLISEPLEQCIGDCLRRGHQALLLLNRRGFAASLLCRSCGERIPCPDCSVNLTLHRAERALRCHYCDHRCAVPENCPVCGSPQLHELGHGTQQLHAAVRQLFPAARVRRFDADETRRKGAHAEILSAFGRGELDMLVGTQMLAKGHDFPGVTLVGAVGADDALGLPDFRAAERTFHLLTQMAGRAGRGENPGTVLMQAYQPDHYAIEAAIKHDYGAFYTREIEFRRRLAYPPFEALIACLCRGRNAMVVKEEADLLAAALRNESGTDIHVLGPASPPLGRLRGLHRIQVLLRGRNRARMRTALRRALDQLRQSRTAPRDLRIDVDPINLM